jgi:hypothetical protein
MAIESLLLDRKLSAEVRMNGAGTNSRGDPKPITDKGTARKSSPGRTRDLCHQFASHFRIGHDYDWEEQYREFSEYWKNYFEARHFE